MFWYEFKPLPPPPPRLVTTQVPCISCGETITDTCYSDWRGFWHKGCDPEKARFPQYATHERERIAKRITRQTLYTYMAGRTCQQGGK